MQRSFAVRCGLAAVTLVAASSASLAASAAPRTANASHDPAQAAAAGGSVGHGVVTVTGDSVRLRSVNGATSATVVPAHRSGAAGSFQRVANGNRTYLIPVDARPYLGSVLDPELFDLTALAKAGSHRIPVRISGSSSAAVPGLHVTSRQAGAASGYLTAASARSFGAALARQYARDAAAGFPAHRSLFGATRIALATPLPTPARPDYPMRTLIIKATDLNGNPARFAFLDVYNTDNLAKYFGFAFLVHGVARVSVPVGTYGLDTSLDRLNANNVFVGQSVLVKQGIKVSAATQTVSLDARDATSKVTIHTPKPADLVAAQFLLNGSDAQGDQFGDGYGSGSDSLYVQPAPGGGSVNLTSEADFTLVGAGSGANARQYVYQLRFPGKYGVPVNQSYTVSSGVLATYTANLYAESLRRPGYLFTAQQLPTDFFTITYGAPVTVPSTVDTYVNHDRGAVYYSSLWAPPNPDVNPFDSAVDDGPRLLPPGSHQSADWERGPALTQVPVDTGGNTADFPFDCPDCRTPKRMQILLDPAEDTTPGHSWEIFGNDPSVIQFHVYRDGKLVDHETGFPYADIAAPRTASTYRIVTSVDRTQSDALQSRFTNTDLTFRSSAGNGAALPGTWSCYLGEDSGSTCRVLPLLKAAVSLPVNGVGSIGQGQSTIALALSHIQGAPKSAITSAVVQIRLAGAAWKSLPITRQSDGRYHAKLLTGRAQAGKSYDLRIVGTDAAGGRIVQSVNSAFAVSAS